MSLRTLFLPRRRMSLQSVNCSSVNSCLESKSLNSSIGKLMISRTLIGKLKPNARRSSRDSCDTLIPGVNPAMLAAASAAKDFRFRSLLEDPDPEPECEKSTNPTGSGSSSLHTTDVLLLKKFP